MTVYATTTVYEGLDLLPHWLDHYRKLGVDEIFVAAGHRKHNNHWVVRAAQEACARFSAKVFPFEYTVCHDDNNLAVRKVLFSELPEDTWILHADLDEFHTYPVHLLDMIESMESRKMNALIGTILDRVAEDGSLPKVQAEPDIGSQFPLGCTLTKAFWGGTICKIVLCRKRVQMDGSQSRLIGDGRKEPHIWDGSCVSHHFRWTDELVERSRWRVRAKQYGPGYRNEVQRFLNLWDRDHKLPIDDPKANTRTIGSLVYPPRTIKI